MGKFEKGREKTGGRQKGTLNKRRSIVEMLEAKGCDPFEILTDMAMGIGLYEEPTRLAAAKELCQYIEPKLKSVEIKNADGEMFRVVIEDYSGKEKK